MRLIYIANYRFPTEKAHGIQIAKTCEALSINGVDLTLIYPRRANEITDDPFLYYKLPKLFKVVQLPILDLSNSNTSLGFTLTSLSFAWQVGSYVKKRQYRDWVYTRDNLTLAILLLRKYRKIVFEIHTWPASLPVWRKFLYKRVPKIVVINAALQKVVMRDLRRSSEDVLIAHDGVDLKRFGDTATQLESRNQLNIPVNKRIIMYCGHLYDWKGVNTLAMASKHLHDEYMVYVVGGTKKDEARFKEFLDEHQISRVTHVVHQSPHRIPSYLRAADVLVIPNSGRDITSRLYTSPLKVFEYMASKRPIVASDLSSLREILNLENAVLVTPDNPQALAVACMRLVQDTSFAQKLAAHAYHDVQKYRWEERARSIINFLSVTT